MSFRAKYLGDHNDFSAWGIRFPRGVFVPVDDPHAQAKISANCHFEVEKSDAEDVEFTETLKQDFAQPEASIEVEPVAEPEAAPVIEERQKRPYNRRK